MLDSQTENGFYKIQSEGVLDGGRTGLAKTAEYDFNEMYAYISADYVSIINIGSKTGSGAAGAGYKAGGYGGICRKWSGIFRYRPGTFRRGAEAG